jgi:hypothetical protein
MATFESESTHLLQVAPGELTLHAPFHDGSVLIGKARVQGGMNTPLGVTISADKIAVHSLEVPVWNIAVVTEEDVQFGRYLCASKLLLEPVAELAIARVSPQSWRMDVHAEPDRQYLVAGFVSILLQHCVEKQRNANRVTTQQPNVRERLRGVDIDNNYMFHRQP